MGWERKMGQCKKKNTNSIKRKVKIIQIYFSFLILKTKNVYYTIIRKEENEFDKNAVILVIDLILEIGIEQIRFF